MPPAEAPFLGQDCRSPYSWREHVARAAWVMVQSTLFRFSPSRLHGWRAWLLRCFGSDIPQPSQVVIFPSTRVHFPWQLRLEPHSMVGREVTLYNLGRITLRRGANISQRSHLCAGTHDYRRWSMPVVRREIVIGENVWVAAQVFVGPGVTIGELAVVAAGSVVLDDLPERTVCAGNPCRVLKPRPEPS